MNSAMTCYDSCPSEWMWMFFLWTVRTYSEWSIDNRQPPSIHPKSMSQIYLSSGALRLKRSFNARSFSKKKLRISSQNICFESHLCFWGHYPFFEKQKSIAMPWETHGINISNAATNDIDQRKNCWPEMEYSNQRIWWKKLGNFTIFTKKNTSTGQPLPFISILNLHQYCWWKKIRLTTVWMVPKTL